MLEGVWIVAGTAKIFAEQNGDRGVEILDSAPFDATHGLLPCYNRESIWGGSISRPRGNTLPPQTDSLGLIDNTSCWWQGLIP